MLKWFITSSVLILAVVLIRRFSRGKASARAIYALWLLVALRLLIPGSIGESHASVTAVVERAPVVQLSERLQGAESIERQQDGKVEAHYPGGGNTAVIAESATEREFNFMSALLSLKKLVMPLWLTGAGIMALVFAGAWLRFTLTVRKRRVALQAGASPVPVYVSGAVDSPCLFGLVRLVIYVTPEVAEDAGLLRHALVHEVSHYRQRDHVWCALRCICLALHWYNPLVWLAASLSKRDCELACDEAAVKRLGEAERASYGRSLIRLTCERPRGAAVATTMSAKPGQLRERISMLTRNRHSVIAIVLAVLLTLTATACSFVGGEPAVTTAPGSLSYVSVINDMHIYDFTAPEGTGAIEVTAWRYNGSRWEAREVSSQICNAAEGSIAIDVDLGLDKYSWAAEFSGTSYSSPEYDFDSIAARSGLNWSDINWLPAEVEARLNEAVPLAMLSGVEGDTYEVHSSLSYFDEPRLIEDSNQEYICITATFLAADGKMSLRGQDESTDEPWVSIFDFTAPSGAQSVMLRYYRYNNGAWECRRFSEFPCSTRSGYLTFDLEPAFSSSVTFSDGTGSGVELTAPDDIAQTGSYDWGMALNDTRSEAIGLQEEVPLILFRGAPHGGERDGNALLFDYFEHPEHIGDTSDALVIVTAAFLDGGHTDISPAPDGEAPTSEPEPVAAQGAEPVGFRAAYEVGASYEDIASAWVHAYAENLVRGLDASDPASCSSVSIEEYTVLYASLTQPERIIASIELKCDPRDFDACVNFFDQIPLLLHPVEFTQTGDGKYVIIDRYVTLQLDGTTVTCVAAGTEMPDTWGYQCLAERDDLDGYFLDLAGTAGVTPETLVSAVNYAQLRELSSESWMLLLEAMDAVDIAPEGSDDQLVRDMYAMLAVNGSDGAYSVWVGNVLRDQREHDPTTFGLALSAFDEETQQQILYLADTPL